MIPIHLSALLLLLAAPPAPLSASVQSGRERALAEFQARIERDVLADDVGGLSAAVFVGAERIWAGGFGVADHERGTDARVDTIYRIGSITKPITAVTMMMLAQRGVLSIDDPVVKHLPEFAGLGGGLPEARTITLRQLASHTAGLVREPALEDADAGPFAQWQQKVLVSIPATTLGSRRGTEFAYSNIGYGILGLALERAAHEPFPELVRRLVFEPAGMSSSLFVVSPEEPRLSRGVALDAHGAADTELPEREHAGRGYKVPNGGAYSTVEDMGRFLALVSGALGDAVLTAASRKEMLTQQTPPVGEAYGLGFSLGTDAHGRTFASHSGAVAGYASHAVLDIESGTSVVLLRNADRGRTNLQRAAEELLGALLVAGKD